MANKRIKAGFIPIPNKIMDALLKIRIPGEARQVLDAILRKTYGWDKSEDEISLSQFEEMTGLPRPSICRAINKLSKMNIIVKKGNAKSLFSKRGNDFTSVYSLQKNHEDWHTLTKKPTLINKNANDRHVNKKVNLTLTKKRHTKESIKERIYSQTSSEVRLSEFLFSFLKARHSSHKEPDFQKWAKHIDWMVSIDNRSVEDIEKIIKWCQADDFWGKSILSTESLRRQFDNLWVKSGFEKRKRYY